METLLKLLEWGSGLSTIPKILFSIIIIAVAGFLLASLWSTSARKVEANQKVGSISLDKIEGYKIATDIQHLRRDNGVNLIEERQDGRHLLKLPKCSYGFCPPWMLNTDPVGVVGGTGIDRIDLTREGAGTAVLEIHKNHEGNYYAIAYCSGDTATVLEDSTRRIPAHCILYMSPSSATNYAVAIPVANIVDWEDRRAGSEYVVDGVLL